MPTEEIDDIEIIPSGRTVLPAASRGVHETVCCGVGPPETYYDRNLRQVKCRHCGHPYAPVENYPYASQRFKDAQAILKQTGENSDG